MQSRPSCENFMSAAIMLSEIQRQQGEAKLNLNCSSGWEAYVLPTGALVRMCPHACACVRMRAHGHTLKQASTQSVAKHKRDQSKMMIYTRAGLHTGLCEIGTSGMNARWPAWCAAVAATEPQATGLVQPSPRQMVQNGKE